MELLTTKPAEYYQRMRITKEFAQDRHIDNIIAIAKKKFDEQLHGEITHWYMTFFNDDYKNENITIYLFSRMQKKRLYLTAPGSEIKQAIAKVKEMNSHLKFTGAEPVTGYNGDDCAQDRLTTELFFE